MSLPVLRQRLYDSLEQRIGNTPLVEIPGALDNDNRLLLKLEHRNPFGTHYDRVYVRLFRELEAAGKITPGDAVVETTSGSAGRSFAGIGRELGYACHVALPAGGEQAREEAIKALGATIHLTPAADYVNAFPGWIKGFLAENPSCRFLNHSMGPRGSCNETTLAALETMASEVLAEQSIDVFVPAIGNGSSVLGPGRRFRQEGVRVVGYESVQSAVALEMLRPGWYQRRLGIAPGSLPRHALPGTSYRGIPFPHVRHAVSEGVLDDVVLVADEAIRTQYEATTGRSLPPAFPCWDDDATRCLDVGRTTRAGIAVARQLSRETTGRTFLVLAYDSQACYDA